MYYRSKSLCKYLDKYKRIIVYGTGDYAHRIYPYLVEYGLKEKIICFSQTAKKTIASIDGIPIIEVEELDCDQIEDVILIAVSDLYVDEIRETLLRRKYYNLVSLIDYEVKGVELCHFFSKEKYYKFLVDWYVETHLDTLTKDELLYKLLSKRGSDRCKVEEDLIVMICGHISIRSNKIISALKKRNFRIIMLDYNSSNVTWCFDELQKMNVERYSCYCIEEMLYRAMQYCPLVYFFEPQWGDCLWAEAMLKNKEYFGKIVIALYDVMNDGYVSIPQSRLDTEKYALENADGIVWRWFSKEYLGEKGFNFRGKSIQFLDCCSNTDDIKYNLDEISQIVKLCAVSGFGEAYVKHKEYESNYIDFARIEEILKRIGNKKDCIFHFFVGSLTKESIERCKQYELQYENFKFYLNVEHNKLLEQLKNYDYVCNLYTDGIWPPNDVIVGKVTGSNMRNSVRNTFFDCLSVGLPIITTVPEKCVKYLSQFGVIVDMNLSTLDIDYLRQNKGYYKNNVRIASKELNIDNQIVKLINFFREV